MRRLREAFVNRGNEPVHHDGSDDVAEAGDDDACEKFSAALTRIMNHEVRSDRRHRGMVDVSEVEALQRIARVALTKA